MATIGDKYSKGLGDTIAKAIKAVAPSLKECGGCAKRRAALNRLIPYNKRGQLWQSIMTKIARVWWMRL